MQPPTSGSAEQVLRTARDAQLAWAALPLSARIRALRGVKARLLSQADAIATLLLEETGKPIEEALLAEVLPNADLLDYWRGSITDFLEPEDVSLDPLTFPGKTGQTFRDPRGVVLLITPWNYPVAIPLRTIVPALLAGNAVVFKPSEVTPRAGALVASLFDGLPFGVFSLVQGGPEVGRDLVEQAFDLVVFTGSVRTGRAIAESCARRLIPTSLELGGKDAALVLADADLERAARGIVWAAFTNAGQNCSSIERVYVESAVAEPFIARVIALTRELRPGVDTGTMTTRAQLEIVREHVTQAIAAGATLLAGGPPPLEAAALDPHRDEPRSGEPQPPAPGLFFPPTVLRVGVERMALMEDETFGPVLPICVVGSAEEAIARANDSRFGLTASIWSRHIGRAETLARRLRAGVVTINNHAFTAALPNAPWSGVGESGHGVTNSGHALADLTRPRFLLVDSSRARSELWWYPYTPALRTVARSMAVLRGGGGFFARVRALFRLLVAFPKRRFGG